MFCDTERAVCQQPLRHEPWIDNENRAVLVDVV
jgi:hypothetical protein